MWTGRTSSNRPLTGFVLDDGSFYVFYGDATFPTATDGFVQGTSTSSGGAFSSSDARDFNFEGSGVLPATISGSYVARQTLTGTIACASGPVTFSAAFNAAYDVPASLATLAGTYNSISDSVPAPADSVDFFPTLTISSSGSLSGSSSGSVSGTRAAGCTVSGSVSPRARGNAYNVSITFGPAPCLFPGQAFSGLAYFDAAKRSIFVAVTDQARAAGVMVLGTKP